ncbi:MAG: RepB family DNA primase [Deltaproteobacteria bacterium]|jgi:hypothetical protein|nr:RepB family DNA primase [Deltaproteobacteria bacterium]
MNEIYDDFDVPQEDPLAVIKNSFSKIHAALGADTYSITRVCNNENFSKYATYSPPMSPQEFLSGSIFCETLNQARKKTDIFLTARSKDRYHMLVDDLTYEMLHRLKAEGFLPVVIIESSTKNLQAILNIRKPKPSFDVTEDEIAKAANFLFRHINKNFGDRNISGVIHPFRWPGTWNWKPKRRLSNGNAPEVLLIESKEVISFCKKSEDLFLEKLIELKNENVTYFAKLKEENMKRKKVGFNLSFISPDDAFCALYEDANKGFNFPDDYSKRDAHIAVKLRVLGFTKEQIRFTLLTLAKKVRPLAKQDSHDWAKYAELTAEYVFSLEGSKKTSELSKFKDIYLSIVKGV